MVKFGISFFLLSCFASAIQAQDPGHKPPPVVRSYTNLDMYMSDSGAGFEGQNSKCAFVYCGSFKELHKENMLRIIKVCGGMVGSCSTTVVLNKKPDNTWNLEYKNRQKPVQVHWDTAIVSIQSKNRIFIWKLDNLGPYTYATFLNLYAGKKKHLKKSKPHLVRHLRER
jgi:hypothetical protein